jgi:hypothetical protein
MICSDSLSCLLAIESCKTQNPFILKIVEIYKSLVAIGKHALKIELADGYRADGYRAEKTCSPKTAADATLPPSFEPSVYIVKY